MKKLILLLLISTAVVTGYILLEKNKAPRSHRVELLDKAILEKIFNMPIEEFPEEGVSKVSVPRKDLHVQVKDYALDPFMGLTTWFAFQKGQQSGIHAMAMGDVVLQEYEVHAAMRAALQNDVAVTALHNHFIGDSPKIYFMHINAEGDTAKVALGCMKIIEAIKDARPIESYKDVLPNAIDGAAIEQILGIKGQAKNGMFKVVVGRTVHAGCGCSVGKNMGINTWAAFGGTNDDAIVAGDFVVFESELQGVLKVLTNADIHVVAIHNHMIFEKPRLIFLHYQARGPVANIAHILRDALKLSSKKGM